MVKKSLFDGPLPQGSISGSGTVTEVSTLSMNIFVPLGWNQ
jgi:hypothetical protein